MEHVRSRPLRASVPTCAPWRDAAGPNVSLTYKRTWTVLTLKLNTTLLEFIVVCLSRVRVKLSQRQRLSTKNLAYVKAS